MSDHMDPLDLLTHELSRVSVSSDFAARVRDRIAQSDELGLETLTTELAGVSVSPEFAVRVRQQIESAPARPRWFAFFDWRWAVPVGATAAIVAAVLFPRAGAPVTSNANSETVQASTSQQMQPSPNQTPIAPAHEAPSALQPAPQLSGSITPRRQRTTVAAVASVQQVDDKLEVITYQPATLQEWWDRAARSEVASQVGTVEEASAVDARDVVVDPVEVNQVVVKWLVEPSPSVTLPFPFIRRLAAELAERSSK